MKNTKNHIVIYLIWSPIVYQRASVQFLTTSLALNASQDAVWTRVQAAGRSGGPVAACGRLPVVGFFLTIDVVDTSQGWMGYRLEIRFKGRFRRATFCLSKRSVPFE